MGHRNHSAPRRGSLAFYPRVRAKSLESRIRTWPIGENPEQPNLLGFAGFKAGQIQIMTIDDREKTPNHGKNLMNASTVISTPPITIIGIRCYKKDEYGKKSIGDIYAKDLPKDLSRKFNTKKSNTNLERIESNLNSVFQYSQLLLFFQNKLIYHKKLLLFMKLVFQEKILNLNMNT